MTHMEQPSVPVLRPIEPEGDYRLFVAIELPLEVRSALADLQDRLRKGFNFTPCRPEWSPTETMHLTLRFLGKFSGEAAAALAGELAAAAARHPVMKLAPGGLGVFPHWHAPKVLWAGVHERTGVLAAFQGEIEQVARRHAAKPEPNPFQAHLTLARFKSMKGIEAARTVVQSHQALRLPIFEADQAVLFMSEKEGASVRHVPLGLFPLRPL